MHQQTDYHKVEDAMYVLAYKMGHSREEESREAANVYFRTYRKLYDGWIEQLRPTFLVPDSSGKHPVSLVMDPKEYPAAYIRRLSLLRVRAADAMRKRPNATYISDAFNRLPKFTDEQVELDSRGTLSWIPYGSYPE